MHVITTVAEMQHISQEAFRNNQTVGCVPTMGALHAGHASLISAAAKENPVVVVSIFVNPTQFGPNEDFETYPRTLEADIQIASQAGATHIFAPSVKEMYPNGTSTKIVVAGVADLWEGASRPGHFSGVATVVCKLFQAMLPTVAYFGQKDYQQTRVVQQMATSLLLPVRISVQPTAREANGLAMSSRNIYLTPEQRKYARVINAALRAASDTGSGHRSGVEQTMLNTLASYPDFVVDYACAADAQTLELHDEYPPGAQVVLMIAGKLGTTRLIDNHLYVVH